MNVYFARNVSNDNNKLTKKHTTTMSNKWKKSLLKRILNSQRLKIINIFFAYIDLRK